MSKASEFKVPVSSSDTSNFTPMTKLPQHLDEFAHLSLALRAKMTPIMQTLLELTDKTALRSAAIPQTD